MGLELKKSLNEINGDTFQEGLLSQKLISKDQLEIAVLEAKKAQKSLERALIDLSFLTEYTLTSFQAELEGLEKVDFKNAILDGELIQKLPRKIAESQLILPITIEHNILRLAMVDIHNLPGLDAAREVFPEVKDIQPLLSCLNLNCSQLLIDITAMRCPLMGS